MSTDNCQTNESPEQMRRWVFIVIVFLFALLALELTGAGRTLWGFSAVLMSVFFALRSIAPREIARQYNIYIKATGEAPNGPGAYYFLYWWPSLIDAVMAGFLLWVALGRVPSPVGTGWIKVLIAVTVCGFELWLRFYLDPHLKPVSKKD